MSSLRDQVALVTGSSQGIGAAIARSFVQQGAKVVIHGSGSIITTSSGAGRRPHPGRRSPYSVAKAGIELMS